MKRFLVTQQILDLVSGEVVCGSGGVKFSCDCDGTETTRIQLYFSPYSFPNNLKLNNLLFPGAIFSENFEN